MLIGNCGNNPQIRTVGDRKVASFSLATTEKYKGKDGNVIDATEWHNVVIWDKLAEVTEKFVTKGTPLYIEGKIKTEKYTDQSGVDRFTTKIYVQSMQMLGGKSDSHTPAPQPKPATTPLVDGIVEPDDSDLPF